MTVFDTEIWTWYGLSWIIVIARMISRRMLLGSIKKLQVEDCLMIMAMFADTIIMVGISIVSRTNSNLIDPKEVVILDALEIRKRSYGSKWVLVVEQMQIVTIWLMKYCLLLMYNRLTMSLSQNLAVKFVTAYVTAGLLVMEVLYLGVWCRPFNQYWAVPPDNAQCSAARNHLITNAITNITSDIMIILIPMPILLKSQLPLKRKAVLVGVFALGAFTILSAILNKFYSFNQPFGSDWTFWYIRESSTAIITANLPYIWTLLRRIFKVGSFSGSTCGKNTNDPSKAHRSNLIISRSAAGCQTRAEHNLHHVDSDEEFLSANASPLKIYAKREVLITSEEMSPRDGRGTQGCVPTSFTSTATDCIHPFDVETSSERSVAGIVKIHHGI
ncbi:integral membrane protein PTH11 [Fusarium pseudocircinatum]|uniref:Integral membrane protein PTH11 n=1 Tax=Fusarium pseudocircinatum TaxID=56676 RepID=A0A8H5KQX8_9HYPO|nr:integral membrane protein PTH11 [Fusarium pseudocircinatum]